MLIPIETYSTSDFPGDPLSRLFKLSQSKSIEKYGFLSNMSKEHALDQLAVGLGWMCVIKIYLYMYYHILFYTIKSQNLFSVSKMGHNSKQSVIQS